MKRKLLRLIIPKFPSFNIYTSIAKRTTALGPILVASAANKMPGWEVEVIDENNSFTHRPKWLKKSGNEIDHAKLQRERPADIVGFYGSLSSTIPRVYELAETYKTLGAITIVGGYHVRSLPQEILDHNIDIVAMDGGEQPIIDILQAHDEYCEQPESQSSGVRFRLLSEYWQNVSDVAFMIDKKMIVTTQKAKTEACAPWPLPDFSLLRWARLRVYPINWRRGCPWNCEFCAVKEKPSAATAEELLEVVSHCFERFNAKNFFIVDDHFGGNLSNKNERAELIKALRLLIDYQKKIGRRLNFTVQIRLNVAEDEKLLKLMRQAGISTVCIGYESPIDEELKAMRKGYTAKDMIRWTELWHKAGFFVHGMFIFGYPRKQETLEGLAEELEKYNPLGDGAKRIIGLAADLERDYNLAQPLSVEQEIAAVKKFVKQAKIDTLQLLLAVPLPGTDLRERLMKENRILPLGWEYYDGQFPLFLPDNCTPEELQAGLKEIMGGFYGFRNFPRLVWNWIFHFPRIVFPAALTIAAFRVDWIKRAYRSWLDGFHRNTWIRAGGWFVVKDWHKKFRRSDFPEKLKTARENLAKSRQKDTDKKE